MSEHEKIISLRKSIDALDEKLLSLLSERAGLVEAVATTKRQTNPDNAVLKPGLFYRPDREAQILKKMIDNNLGPLSDSSIGKIFQEIMSASLALERGLNVAYLGPEGTFSHDAVLKHFGHAVTATALGRIDQVFKEVEAERCDYGVVPVENSIEGTVNHTLDMFIHTNLLICGEIELPIHQNLLGYAKLLEEIEQIYSHPHSFAQCRVWLDTHLPKVKRVEAGSNADAAERAVSDASIALIAGESVSLRYGLPILTKNIENKSTNTTRFLVVGNAPVSLSGVDKTSLLLSATNKPGALIKMLTCLADHHISMTRVESRPSPQELWEYVFFVDFEGHMEDSAVQAALQDIKGHASMFKILGSYPSAVL